MQTRSCFGLFLSLLLLGFLPCSYAQAQTPISVTSNQAVVSFPEAITFSIKVKSSADIEHLALKFGTDSRSCYALNAWQSIDFTKGKEVSAKWEWDLTRSGTIPPGVRIWWQWEIQDSSGVSSMTEVKTLIVADNRYDWHSIQSDAVELYWSEGDQSFGRSMLAIAKKSLVQLEKTTGVLPETQVRLTLYPSTQDVQGAALHVPDWTGGLAFPEFNSILIGIAPGEVEWANRVIPHELTHLVTGLRVFNCLGNSLPTWLSEGLAVYEEGPALPEDLADIRKALTMGKLPSLRSLAAGFPADGQKSHLAYTQSGEVVRYLVDSFGSEKMASLLASFQTGNTTDTALQEVYKTDTEGLDGEWRNSLGYAQTEATVSTQASTPKPIQARTPIPTLALWTQAVKVTATPTRVPETTPSLVDPAGQIETGLAPTETTGVPSASTPLEPAGLFVPSLTPVLIAAGVLILAGVIFIFLRRNRA